MKRQRLPGWTGYCLRSTRRLFRDASPRTTFGSRFHAL